MNPRPFPPLFAALLCLAAGRAFTQETQPPVVVHAGPITATLADGELRYLQVGDREIVRRIYFAVRDDTWRTATPAFTRIDFSQEDDTFKVRLRADCKLGAVDYSWTGTITGSSTGEIEFEAEGGPNHPFKSNRIGLCLLFGADALVDQKFEYRNEAGEIAPGQFPRLVSPKHVADKFSALRYTTPNFMQVDVKLEGAKFSMEDQRNFGDSSFKAFAPLPYAYPEVSGDGTEHQKITLSVLGAERKPAVKADPLRLRIGNPIPGAKIPQVKDVEPNPKLTAFSAINAQRETYQGQKVITLAFNPSTHLRDDDMFMENLVTPLDQVKTLHSFAPDAVIHYDPVGFDAARPPGAPTDPRSETEFGAVWSAAILKEMALAGVESVGMVVAGDPARKIQHAIGAHAGTQLLETIIDGPKYPAARPRIDALAIMEGQTRTIWLLNLTGDLQEVDVAGLHALPALQPWEVRELTRVTPTVP